MWIICNKDATNRPTRSFQLSSTKKVQYRQVLRCHDYPNIILGQAFLCYIVFKRIWKINQVTSYCMQDASLIAEKCTHETIYATLLHQPYWISAVFCHFVFQNLFPNLPLCTLNYMIHVSSISASLYCYSSKTSILYIYNIYIFRVRLNRRKDDGPHSACQVFIVFLAHFNYLTKGMQIHLSILSKEVKKMTMPFEVHHSFLF